MFEQPQRHRDTEKTQSHPLVPAEPLGGGAVPTSQTRRHKGTKKSQSHPPTQKRRGAETQRRRGSLARLLRVARFRPSDGREPLGRDTDPNASIRRGVPTQRPALQKRRPRHFSSLFNGWVRHAPSTKYGREERQNRRAPGTSVGEKSACSERERSSQPVFSPATGDSRSPVVLPPISGTAFQAQPPPLRVFVSSCLRLGRAGGSASICVICGLNGWVGALRLCVSATLRFFLCVSQCASVPLWFFVPRSVGIVE
jgi:hypothetical protein